MLCFTHVMKFPHNVFNYDSLFGHFFLESTEILKLYVANIITPL